MGAHDPTPEFWMLLREIEAGRSPEKAVGWFDSAFETVDSINATIASMKANGVPAPTEGQARALANYHRAVCHWLGRVPSEDECRAEMLTRSRADSPHTCYPTRRDGPATPRVRKVKHFPAL